MTTVASSAAAGAPHLFLLDPAANRNYVAGQAARIGSSRTMLLLAFICLLVVIGAGGFVLYAELNAQALEREGITTNAIIVDGYSSTSSRGGTTYHVTYELTVNKQPYRREVAISSSLYNRLAIGRPVSVRYLMGDPNINVLWDEEYDGTERDANRAIGAIIGLSALVVGLLCVWIDMRNRRVSKGTLLRGQIVSSRVESTRRGTYIVEVTYTFTTPSGGIITGKGRGNRPDLRRAALPSAGTPVLVLYLNDKTHRLM